MPEIVTGKVEAVLVGDSSGISKQVNKIHVLANQGIKGDWHNGPTRLLDVREKVLTAFGLLKGTEIANFRQFSAISKEQLAEIAGLMGIATIPYGLLCENLVISGVDDLTHLPVGSTLLFKKDDRVIRTAALVVWGENTPCETPARNIQKQFPDQQFKAPFQTVAIGKRGVVGVVYSSGFICEGDEVVVVCPKK